MEGRMNANSPYKNIELQYLPPTKNWRWAKNNFNSPRSLGPDKQTKTQDKVRSSKFEN